ncbi:hypothetical protein GF374_00790, partial [Candidatus Woesearchaeota archaeon]|nr:hypothetical protein [Candidatus Woesearchaeota archaeon]
MVKSKEISVFDRDEVVLVLGNKISESELGKDAVRSELGSLEDRLDISQFLDTLEGPVK